MDLRGPSADAYAALTDELDAALGSDAAAVADGLFAVAGTLRTEGSLRRFLSDGSVPGEARQGLVQQVFGGKLADGALRVLSSAVGRRWTAARDLADVLEQLSVVAQVKGAGGDSGRLADELFAFGRAVTDNPGLRDALSDPARSVEDKRGLIDTLLARQALPATVALAKQAVSGQHHTVTLALDDYQRTAAAVHGESVATVRVARDLSEDERTRLAQALERQYGRAVHLNLVVDPAVLGGVRVEIGDDVIDGTVSSRLDDARRRLVG